MTTMTHPILNILKNQWDYLGKRRPLFIFYIFLFVLAAIVHLATPYLIGTIFNSIQKIITTKKELYTLITKISLLLLLTIIFWMFHGTARILEQTTGFFVKKNYINDKIRVLLKLPIKWHKDHHSGDTIDKVNKAAEGLGEFSREATYLIVYGVIDFLGSIIILFFIDFKIGLFAFLFSSITIFIITRIDKRLDNKYRELNTYHNKLSASIFDYISNIITVITLRLRKTVSQEIELKQIAAYPTFKSSIVINEIKWGFASIAIEVMIVTALIARTYTEFNATGAILIGTLYMLYGYLNNVGETFYKFASLYGTIIIENASVTGAYPLDKEYAKLKETVHARLPKHWKTITLRNVSFTYNKESKIIHLENINFTFNKGQKIALVGESGSGKSTILTLIRGLYTIEKGKIYCDNSTLTGGMSAVKEHVTLIPQEPEIFNNTFRYNITMNLAADEETVQKMIHISQLTPVIEKLPKGLDTNVLEKGVSLSGGEKQRLALARGLLAARNSEIVLLDEPTSSVDSLNELKIHENLFTAFHSKTIISSIHRLHLLDQFDYIYLFSKGKIIAQGNLETLKKNPAFHTMWIKYHREKILDKQKLKKNPIKIKN